jgi:hypothetical protein
MSTTSDLKTILPLGTELTLAESRGFTSGRKPSLLVSFYLRPKDAPPKTPDSTPSRTESPTIIVFRAQVVPALPFDSTQNDLAYTNSASEDCKKYLRLVDTKISKPLAQLSRAAFGESPEMSWGGASLEAQGGKMLHAFACILQANAKATTQESSIVLVPPGRWDIMTAPGVNQMRNVAREKASSKATLRLTGWMKEALADGEMEPSPRDVGVYWEQEDGLSIVRLSAECEREGGNTTCAEPSSEAQGKNLRSDLGGSNGCNVLGTQDGFSCSEGLGGEDSRRPQTLVDGESIYVLDPRNDRRCEMEVQRDSLQAVSDYLLGQHQGRDEEMGSM